MIRPGPIRSNLWIELALQKGVENFFQIIFKLIWKSKMNGPIFAPLLKEGPFV